MNPLPFCQTEEGIYAKELKVTVISCAEVDAFKARTGKKKKKEPKQITYEVVLSDTIFFPEGGGQPCDNGTINQDIKVIHVLNDGKGNIKHITDKELVVGTEVLLQLDWIRRYDHMQQHSGQHLISAVIETELKCNTLSWWMSSYPQQCYIDFDCKEIPESQLENLENKINEYIRKGTPQHLTILSNMEDITFHEFFKTHPEKIPTDLHEPMRLMEIPQLDLNPCCGTHVHRLSELQMTILTKVTNKGNPRIHFICGERAIIGYRATLQAEKQLTMLLQSPSDQIVEYTKRNLSEQKSLRSENTQLYLELANLISNDIILQQKDIIETKQRVYYYQSDKEVKMSFLDSISALLREKNPNLTVFLVAQPSLITPDGIFLLSGPKESVDNIAPLVSKELNGRGGGRAGRYQGKCPNLDNYESALKAFLTS